MPSGHPEDPVNLKLEEDPHPPTYSNKTQRASNVLPVSEREGSGWRIPLGTSEDPQNDVDVKLRGEGGLQKASSQTVPSRVWVGGSVGPPGHPEDMQNEAPPRTL